MTYLNNLKNILSNKKFDYTILLTTIGLLNGHNIYATSDAQPEPDTLKNLYILYSYFFYGNNEAWRHVSEEYAVTLLNKNRDRIKNAFPQDFKVNFRGTSCISRCCRGENFADSSVFAPNSNEEIYFKDLVKRTFYIYNIPTLKVFYGIDSNYFIRHLQNILFVCFDENLSELTSSLKQYYQANKKKYTKINISDNTFNNENIKQMLLQGEMLLQGKSDKKHNK